MRSAASRLVGTLPPHSDEVPKTICAASARVGSTMPSSQRRRPSFRQGLVVAPSVRMDDGQSAQRPGAQRREHRQGEVCEPSAPLTEWTVMIKDSQLSWDGWYWGDLVKPSRREPNACPKPPPDGGCAETTGPLQRSRTLLFQLSCFSDRTGYLFDYRVSRAVARCGRAAPIFDATKEMAPFTIEDTSELEAKLAPNLSIRFRAQCFQISRRLRP